MITFITLIVLRMALTCDQVLTVSGQGIQSGYQPPHGSFPNGTFLRIVMLHLPPVLTITRNSSGHVIDIGGVSVPVIQWLSRAVNFNYELMPDNIYSVEDNASGKGLMSYIVEGRADMILGGIAMTSSRFKNLNFPYSYVIGQFGFLIPMPSSQVNLAAVWKPFEGKIWIYLIVSMGTTILCLYGISRCISEVIYERRETDMPPNGKLFEDIGRAFQYVIGVILSQGLLAQGGTSRNQKLTIRLLAGAWCMSCFVLITAYSSVLISFVTSPYYEPLIHSLYDLPKKSQVKVTVNRGWSADLLFTNAEDGIFKYLGDQLRKEPNLRCSVTEDCMERVRKGSSVYTQEYRTLKSMIGQDLKKIGRCDFTIAKELYLSFGAGLALPKSVEIEPYTRALLKAHEAGFIDLWFSRNVVDASRCLNPPREASAKPRVTLGGLSGAFVVLAFGYSLSALSFCAEQIYILQSFIVNGFFRSNSIGF